MSQPAAGESREQKAPTLYAIIVIKLVKGVILLLVALGVYSLSDNNLPEDFRHLISWVHLDPEKKFFTDMEKKIAMISPTNVIVVASGTLFYSLFSLVEGIGLIFRVGWAGWLAIGESLFFVPIEIYELSHGFSVTLSIILVINVVIVAYLYRNRARLFHAHIKPVTPAPTSKAKEQSFSDDSGSTG